MANKIVYVPTAYGNVTNFTFSESYQGINNLGAFLATFAGVSLKVDYTGTRSDCNCGVSFNAGKLETVPMKLDAYVFLVGQLLTKIQTDLGSGVPADSTVIFALSLTTNFSYLKTELWSIYADAVAYFSNINFSVPFKISANMDIGDTMVINGIVGNFGTNAIADGANIVTASGLDSLNGKSATLAFKHINGSGDIVNLSTATAVVTNGIWTGTVTISLTPGERVWAIFTSINVWNIANFGAQVLSTNVGFGPEFAGANFANCRDLSNQSFIFTP